MQKIITATKGVAIDCDNIARDAQAHSKELYLWGQTDDDDIKDGASTFISCTLHSVDSPGFVSQVTDRLAWLSYVEGSLAGSLATKVNESRTPFKQLRDAENALAPRRNIRVGLQNQIARIEHDQRKDQQFKLRELKIQLKKNEEEDEVAERDIDILKRRALRESQREKWEAAREVGVFTLRHLWAVLNLIFLVCREALDGCTSCLVDRSHSATSTSVEFDAIQRYTDYGLSKGVATESARFLHARKFQLYPYCSYCV